MNHDSEYRYTPGQIPGPCTEHPGCFLTACRRLWCTRPVHVALERQLGNHEVQRALELAQDIERVVLEPQAGG